MSHHNHQGRRKIIGQSDLSIAHEQLNGVKNGTCSKEYLTKCRVCDKTFNRKDSLVLHLRTVHLKERRFKCAICQQGFTSNKDLTRHSGTICVIRSLLECANVWIFNILYLFKFYFSKCYFNLYEPELTTKYDNSKRPPEKKTYQKSNINDDTYNYQKHHFHLKCFQYFSAFIHSEQKDFMCKKCPMRFVTKKEVKRHSVRVHGQRKRNDSSSGACSFTTTIVSTTIVRFFFEL